MVDRETLLKGLFFENEMCPSGKLFARELSIICITRLIFEKWLNNAIFLNELLMFFTFYFIFYGSQGTCKTQY